MNDTEIASVNAPEPSSGINYFIYNECEKYSEYTG